MMSLADRIRLCTCTKRDNSPQKCLARIAVVEEMLAYPYDGMEQDDPSTVYWPCCAHCGGDCWAIDAHLVPCYDCQTGKE